MRKIALTLLVFIVITLGLFSLLEIPFDRDFLSSLLNGLLSNFLILFVAIFIIDNLSKIVETKKLKEINKRNSEFFSLRINIFAVKLVDYLKISKTDTFDVDIQSCKNKNLTFEYIWEDIVMITNKVDVDVILYESALKEDDKKKYLSELSDLVMEESKSLHELLKNIYPHPAPEVVGIVDDLSSQSGALHAMSIIADVHKDVNKITNNDAAKMDQEASDVLLKVMMLGIGDREKGVIKSILSSLSQLSLRAKANTLFTD
jgi:hypothetical protein